MLGLGDLQTDGQPSLSEQIDRFEKHLISEALRECAGNVSEACQRLGIPRKTFYDKLKKHTLNPESFRETG